MGIQLHYIEKGQGEPLILLHGNGEDTRYFIHQIEYFSQNYRVIAVDTRGHGKSPRGNAPFTIRQFADDLHLFMNQLNINKADILGFSDGGNIALIFAITYPEYVNRLILNGANLNTAGVKSSIQLPIVIGYKIASLFAAKSVEARKNAEMLGLMVNDPNIPVHELKRITARTLVIVGTNDMIKEKHTREIYEHLLDAELAIIPGDHFIASKKHAEFNQVVEKFLTQKTF